MTMSDNCECESSKERSKEEEDQVVEIRKKSKWGRKITSLIVWRWRRMTTRRRQVWRRSLNLKPIRTWVVAQEIVDNLKPDEIARAVIDDYIMEEEEVDLGLDEFVLFSPKSEVPIMLNEFNEWRKPWKLMLILKLLGKSLGLRVTDRWI